MFNTRIALKRIVPGLALLAAVLGVAASITPAHAQTLTTLYNFTGTPDGSFPEGGLILNAQGNLFGVTLFGGANSGSVGANSGGTVFRLTPNGHETVVHSFGSGLITTLCRHPVGDGPDGAVPNPGLVLDSQGNFYGTTHGGGTCGLGTVFSVRSSGAENVLYRFTGGADGAMPIAGLVMDAQRNLYGTTPGGGFSQFCCGTVFKVTPSGTKTTLYRFTGGADGNIPLTGLALDANGNLYGTTIGGGTHGFGTAFKLAPDGTETVLYSFQHLESPISRLALDSQGNLYGATGNVHNGGTGGGSIFKLTPAGTKTVFHSFTGPDGDGPSQVIFDQQDNLYGTTGEGGVGGCLPLGCGVIFRITPNGTQTVLYDFTGGPDGADPFGALVRDAQGNLYGTTLIGGSGTGCISGCGTVFKLAP